MQICKFFFWFFFFCFYLGCGFHVIVGGGGGVGLIPCDLGCINGVDSSLHFFFFFFGEFCVDFGDFFFKVVFRVLFNYT